MLKARELWAQLLRVYRVNGPRETARRAIRKARSTALGDSFDEVEVVQQVLTARSAHGLMVDVGAQRGNTLSGFLNAGWTVKAFEPDPVNVAELRARFEGSQNLEVFELALGDAPKSNVEFFGSRQSTGISGLLKFHETHEVVTYVDVSTLEIQLAGLLDQEIDFLKVDTEGFDLAVLKGANLAKLSPRVVVAEFDEAKVPHGGHSLSDLEELLVAVGYEFFVSEWFPISEYGGDHRWRQLCDTKSDLADSSAWGNIVACKESELLQILRAEIASATR